MLERLRVEVERPPERFEDFYVKEYSAVVGLAYALSGSRTGAEDLAQEAFLAAYRDWDRIAGYEQPGAWVRRVVANRSVSSFRRRTAEAKALARAALGRRLELPDLGSSDPEFWEARAVPAETAIPGGRALLPRGPADRRCGRHPGHVAGDREAAPS